MPKFTWRKEAELVQRVFAAYQQRWSDSDDCNVRIGVGGSGCRGWPCSSPAIVL